MPESSFPYGEVITAFASVITALGGNKLFSYLKARADAKRLDKPKDVFRLGFQLSGALHEIRMRLHTHRAMLIKAHNGGGEISIRKPLYTTVHRQVTDDKLPSVTWQKEEVDEDYWRLLKNLVNSQAGFFVLDVPSLQKGSKLRNLYDSQGVVRAYVFELYNTQSEFWFVSCVQKDGDKPLDRVQVAEEIRSARSTIVSILRDELL